jgi:hypothetical protein
MDAETGEADEEGGEEMAEAETDDGEEMEELADAGIALPQASPICVCKVLPPIPLPIAALIACLCAAGPSTSAVGQRVAKRASPEPFTEPSPPADAGGEARPQRQSKRLRG